MQVCDADGGTDFHGLEAQAYRAMEPREHWWHLPDGRTLRVAPLICYDVLDPTLALAATRAGASQRRKRRGRPRKGRDGASTSSTAPPRNNMAPTRPATAW